MAPYLMPKVNKRLIFDVQALDAHGRKWLEMAKMGKVKSANTNHSVDFLFLGDSFGPHRILSFEIFQIEPFLTKLEKIFIFEGFLFSKVTI